MVGGFLGAGKTTTLARMARHYQAAGKRVGIVTNDQAENLVDTLSLRGQGFPVEEVAGSCFCCNFNGLLNRMDDLRDHLPDIVLAEPVGSCTDLIATVARPLQRMHGDQFQVAPYAVLLKPSHGLDILSGGSESGFSPKARYVFHKQLEEAELILINRIDELHHDHVEQLFRLVKEVNRTSPVLKVSAKTGAGFDDYYDLLEKEGSFGRPTLDLDYDLYAEGEAELGWLNGSIRFACREEFDLDDLLIEIVGSLRDGLHVVGSETAHLKIIGIGADFFGVANLVSRQGRPESSIPSRRRVREVDLVINARVATDPDILEEQVRATLLAAAASRKAAVEWRALNRFRPGRPVPTHRLVEISSPS